MNDEKPLINYVKEAAMLPINIAFATVGMIAVGAMIALSAPASIWGGALFLMGAAEMFYLRLMPQSARFRTAVNAKYDALFRNVEQNLRTVHYLKDLREKELERFSRIFELKNKIASLIQKKGRIGEEDEKLLERLDTLESHYVQLLHLVSEYEKYLARPRNDGDVQAQIARLENDLKTASPKVAEMIERRIALLKKHTSRTEELKEDLQVALLQLANLDDTFSLIFQEASSPSNMGQIQATIAQALNEVEVRRQTMRELDAILNENVLWPEIETEDSGKNRLATS
ncbi:MAG: hypothetical protein NZ534_00905 [Bacteroidia bacterium]|nr:hypothetical protein [Bacteroidia bacterium]